MSDKACRIEGCLRTDLQAFGLCSLHYNRLRRTGDPEKCLKYHRHGMKGTPEHNSWSRLKERCCNKNDKQYKDYGGRGVIVCDRWLGPEGFENFYKDMGPKPSPEYSIDRIDNNLGYTPENCKWSNRWEQNSNRRWKNKSTGIVGVRRFNEKYWIGEIIVNGKRHTKYTKTKEEAIEARKKLEEEYL